MVAELELAAELDGGDAAGAPVDARTLFLSQAGQQRQDASTRGHCQIAIPPAPARPWSARRRAIFGHLCIQLLPKASVAHGM